MSRWSLHEELREEGFDTDTDLIPHKSNLLGPGLGLLAHGNKMNHGAIGIHCHSRKLATSGWNQGCGSLRSFQAQETIIREQKGPHLYGGPTTGQLTGISSFGGFLAV